MELLKTMERSMDCLFKCYRPDRMKLEEEDSIMMKHRMQLIKVMPISSYDGYTLLAPECCSHATYSIAFSPSNWRCTLNSNPHRRFLCDSYHILTKLD